MGAMMKTYNVFHFPSTIKQSVLVFTRSQGREGAERSSIQLGSLMLKRGKPCWSLKYGSIPSGSLPLIIAVFILHYIRNLRKLKR